MNTQPEHDIKDAGSPGKGCLIGCGILLLVLAIILTTAGITVWAVKRQINPAPLQPIVLNAAEQQILNHKVEQVKAAPAGGTNVVSQTEVPKERLIEFTEKELNALIAKKTELGAKVRIDLERDEIYARFHLPVPEGSPFLGGTTLSTGLRLTCSFRNGEPELILRKITVGGISIPNAWTGNRKNNNLLGEAADREPELKAVLDGIEEFSLVKDGLRIVLRE